MKIINNGTAQVCRACLEVKPLKQFYKLKETETGYSRYCKDCGYPAHQYTYRRSKDKAIVNRSFEDLTSYK